MTRTEIERFFERYRDAFNRLDGDAVAALWHTPSGIADSQGAGGTAQLTWWPQADTMRANHRALCEVYRAAGHGRARFTLGDTLAFGRDHAVADVHWTVERTDGSLLQAFRTGYQLIRTGEGPQVLLCTAYEEDLQETRRDAA